MSESELSLKQQVKAAKRDKYLAQAKKAEAEKLKIDLDYKDAKAESLKNWWFKKDSRIKILTAIIGLSFLGFYIDFVVVPASNIKNLEATLENKKTAILLYDREQQLHLDSVKLVTREHLLANQIRYIDSVNSLVNAQNTKINLLKIARHKVDSTYSILVKLYAQKQDLNNVEVQLEFKKLKQYLDEYKLQKNEYVASISTIPNSNYTYSNSIQAYSSLINSSENVLPNPYSSFPIAGITNKSINMDSLLSRLGSGSTPSFLGNLMSNSSLSITGLNENADSILKKLNLYESSATPARFATSGFIFHPLGDSAVIKN